MRGFVFKSAPWYDERKEDIQYRFVLVYGYLTRDVTVTCKKEPVIHFYLGYARRRFVECVVRQKSAPESYEIARRLLKRDPVFIGGIMQYTEYDTKRGKMPKIQIDGSLVLPIKAVRAAMDHFQAADAEEDLITDDVPDGLGLDGIDRPFNV